MYDADVTQSNSTVELNANCQCNSTVIAQFRIRYPMTRMLCSHLGRDSTQHASRDDVVDVSWPLMSSLNMSNKISKNCVTYN